MKMRKRENSVGKSFLLISLESFRQWNFLVLVDQVMILKGQFIDNRFQIINSIVYNKIIDNMSMIK